MTHRRDDTRGTWKRIAVRLSDRLLTWSNVVRLAGLGGFYFLIRQPEERVFYMVGCLALLTFGLPGAIRFDRERQKEPNDE